MPALVAIASGWNDGSQLSNPSCTEEYQLERMASVIPFNVGWFDILWAALEVAPCTVKVPNPERSGTGVFAAAEPKTQLRAT